MTQKRTRTVIELPHSIAYALENLALTTQRTKISIIKESIARLAFEYEKAGNRTMAAVVEHNKRDLEKTIVEPR